MILCKSWGVSRLPEQCSAEGLVLRAISREFFSEAYEAVGESRTEVREWLWWAQDPLDESTYMDFIKRNTENFLNDLEWRYFIFDGATNRLVGGCSLEVLDSEGERSANVGYWVRTSCTGRGIATRTARALTDVAFTYLSEIDSVEIGMDRANLASARIPEKLGFAFVGEREKLIRAPGHTGRGLLWKMSRSAWEESHKRS